MNKLVGRVSEQERDEIRQLFERRNGLNELAKILTSKDEALYEKLIADFGHTSTKFQDWWNRASSMYKWESADNGHWEINFETCEIFLVVSE